MSSNRPRPAHIILFLAGITLWTPPSATHPLDDLHDSVTTEVYSVAPTGSGDMVLRMDLYLPQFRPVRGAVILAHGGSFVTGSRNIDENVAYGRALASRGYLAAAISYRLLGDDPAVSGWAASYAETIRRSDDPRIQKAITRYGPGFPNAVAAGAEDLVAAIRWLGDQARKYGLEADDIAIFGASAGAISALTTAYAIDEYGGTPPAIAAVIALRGLFLFPGDSTASIERQDPPLLILHGESDLRVPIDLADDLFEVSRKAGIYVEYFSAPEYGHGLGGATLLNLGTGFDETVLDRIDGFLSSAFGDGNRVASSIRGRLHRLPSVGVQEPGPADLAGIRAELVDAVNALIEATADKAGFVESLYRISRRDLLLHPFDDPQRLDWSYWPRHRAGLPLGYMTAHQRSLTQEVLATLLSSKGYLQANHVMMLEKVLADLETVGFVRGVGEYTIAVFGAPEDDEPWGLRFEGHHLSLNITVTRESIDVTPSFIGASPAIATSGTMAGFGPLKYEQRLTFALLHSLDAEQRAEAIIADVPPAEIFSSQFQKDGAAWDDWKALLDRGGIAASAMNADQRQMLRRLLLEIVCLYRDELVTAYLDALDPETLTFAWMGSEQIGQPHYFRIVGERFVFELDAAQENGNHVHSVWRDRSHDFGADVLRRHYERHHLNQ